MKKTKTSLLPGLSVLLCFCLLTGTGKLIDRYGGGAGATAAAEALSFLLPFLLAARALPDGKRLRHRLKPRRLPRGAMTLTVQVGLTIAVLSLFLNLLVYQLAGLAGTDLSTTVLDASQSGFSLVARLLVVVLLSAVAEELFLRGALFSAQEQRVGTGVCLLFSGFAFALLHGSLTNCLGPFVAGVIYAYLTYLFDSVWPAVLAHGVNNLYYLLVLWLTNTYAAFGIWNYFAQINALVLLLLLYLSLRTLQTMLVRGRVPHFEQSAGLYDVMLLVRDPGVLLFVLAFAAKAVLHWI